VENGEGTVVAYAILVQCYTVKITNWDTKLLNREQTILSNRNV